MRSYRLPLVLRVLGGVAPALAALATSSDARAQGAGTTNKPLPNVLLLLDTSGSMERMPDNSLPSENKFGGTSIVPGPGILMNACSPGAETNPNRWGMLVQALTGNMQPFFSCAAMSRATTGPGAAFNNEYKIANRRPYDAEYFLPYHRPLTGNGSANACAFAPWELPGAGAGSGVGPAGRGAGGHPMDFPATAFESIRYGHLTSQYLANSEPLVTTNRCTFDQAVDGQLDATRDYVRFALMTFDTDTEAGQGVTGAGTPPPPRPATNTVDTSNPFLGQWSYVSGSPVTALGRPDGCVTPATPFDVGARHWAAPPWEGRMVPFADPSGTLYDLAQTNEQIQKVILGSRPYGATPIDGLVEDARDYLWRSAYGPYGTQAGYEDPYTKNGCRENFIILLTDGAPNLNLRPQCATGTGQCPYPEEAWQVVDDLYHGTCLHGACGAVGRSVKTFVIGFSVNGTGSTTIFNDGFPTPFRDCKSWYAAPAPTGGSNTPTGMLDACGETGLVSKPPAGSTAEACCQLNKIAYYGSGGATGTPVGAFFAETQADLVLSFGRVLANVSKEASSRTPPGYSPVVTLGGAGVSAKYVTSFIPNARKPWSGEIDRTRASCSAAPPGADLPQNATTQGDSYAQNTAAQSIAGKRFFFSVKGAATSGSVIDSSRTLRPYTAATTVYADGIPDYLGTEVGGNDMALTSVTNWAEAMDIDANTCKRSRAPNPSNPSQTITVPRLDQADCRDVIWNFTTASNQSVLKAGTPPVSPSYEFNVRCRGTGGLSTGACSITSATACTPGNVPSGCPAGEVCVPNCAALGAIYHSTPAIVGPPTGALREEAFRQFADGRGNRRPAMFVATTDGILHAFKALETVGGTQGGNANDQDWELWSFVPPAVLPKLAANYPTGQQILLDGSPVVKDVVWDRAAIGNRSQWHTTLVAGMGSGGPGYYALNVSDVDCSPGPACNTAGAWQPSSGVLSDAAAGGGLENGAKRGPHFLWQLTDLAMGGASDKGKRTRVVKAPDNTQMVALFGAQSGTPAITTLQVDPDGTGARQVGVAILPGGIDGPPVKNGQCARGTTPDVSDDTFAGGTTRAFVRQWGTTCDSAVAGRSVTIVRLDTGEIIRHFGRTNQEVPERILAKSTDTRFDSPIVGTPVVYPTTVGATAQRIFVGDADGTVWSIDVSKPDPAQWRASLFQDLFAGGGVADSQPVAVAPVISTDAGGALVLHVATGDQENIVASTQVNYVYALREVPPATPPRNLTTPSAKVLWRQRFTDGERVTGPMLVFDRTLFFATHKPDTLSAVCGAGAISRLWGMDYINKLGDIQTQGGLARWCKTANVDAVTGLCTQTINPTDPNDQREDITAAANAIIPGVTLRPSLSCSQYGSVPDDLASGITGVTPQRFELFFSWSGKSTTSPTGTPTAGRLGVTRPVPRIAATVDAWAFVFD